MQLIIDTARTSITVKNKCFYITNEKRSAQISPKRVSSIAITTDCTLNTAVVRLAVLHEVPIYFFNKFGTVQGRLWSPYFRNIASLRRRQYMFADDVVATTWALDILEHKTNYQIVNLKRLNERTRRHANHTESGIATMESILTQSKKLEGQLIGHCRLRLLGYEGSIARIYWSLIGQYLPPDFSITGRTRQPATDYFNAALNYLYGMTYSIVESGILAKGLDPMAGVIHTDNYNKKSLVYDLIEPIRPLIDRMLIDICRAGELSAADFRKKEHGFWLSKQGKRKLIPDFNDYLYKRLRVDGRVIKLKDIIYGYSNELGNIITNTVEDE